MKHIITAALIVVAIPAAARDIPTIDRDAACMQTDTRTNVFGSHAEQWKNCMADMQRDYDELKSNWSRLSDAEHQNCIKSKELSFGRQYYYRDLVGCTNGILRTWREMERLTGVDSERREIPKQGLRN